MAHRRARLALSLLLGFSLLVPPCGAAAIDSSMSLVDAIEHVRNAGHEIGYSTQFVKPWMRVRRDTDDNDPLSALGTALREYDLALSQRQDGRWLVVERPTLPRSQERNTTAKTEESAVVPPRIHEITIVASKHALFSRSVNSDVFLTGEQIRAMPHIADDTFRAFHRLPGTASNDYQAPFNLRGGSASEVKLVLDGLELFEPYHMPTFLSPLSVIDPGIIGDTHVYTGGFTANYGNHMSGVMDIRSISPATETAHEVGVSFVNAFARTRGSFADGRGSYLLSGRRGYLDLIADSVLQDGETLEPRYNDVFAMASLHINHKLSVSARTLLATDRLDFIDVVDGENFDDTSKLGYFWLSADYEPNDSWQSRLVVFSGVSDTSENGGRLQLPDEDIQRESARDVRIVGIKSDSSLHFDDRRMLKFGGRYRHLEADYFYRLDSTRRSAAFNNGAPLTIRRELGRNAEGDELGFYAAYRAQLTKPLSAEFGLRWDKQTYQDIDESPQLSPRVNVLYSLNDHANVRVAAGRFYQPQGIHELQIEDGVTVFEKAERADHFIVGLNYEFPGGTDLNLDIYRKRYDKLRPRYENALDVFEYSAESKFDRVRIHPDSASAKGVELTLQGHGGKRWEWWLSYTLSEATDSIDGQDVLRSWDQRHAMSANLTYRGDYWTFTAATRYHSGWPRTELDATPIVDGNGNAIGVDTDFSRRNQASFQDYVRLDLRLSRSVQFERSRLQYYFEVFNVFNARNECCVPNHRVNISNTVSVNPNYDHFLPFFPSFGFSWSFGPGVSRN